MKRFLIIALAFSCTFHFFVPTFAADQPAPNDQIVRTPDGTWKPIGAILGGARLPKTALDAITLEISGTNYHVTVEGEKEPDRGTSILHTNTTPARMTIVSTNGPNQGKTFLAIYEMKDDRILARLLRPIWKRISERIQSTEWNDALPRRLPTSQTYHLEPLNFRSYRPGFNRFSSFSSTSAEDFRLAASLGK